MSIAFAFDVRIIEPPPPLETLCVVLAPFTVPNVIALLPAVSWFTIIVPYSPFLTFVKLRVVVAALNVTS